jgi:flagellin-like protein
VLKNLLRNRRALSPIFATLIILAVVTILFVPVFIWTTGISSQTQDSWTSSALTASERIVIEEVYFAGTPPATQSCTIYVRNIGETVITINDVIISQNNGNIHPFQKTQLSTVNPIPPTPHPTLLSIAKGELIEIDIPNLAIVDSTYSIIEGVTYTIQVFTTRGVGDTFQITA